MASLPGAVEWSGSCAVLVRATELTRSPNFPYNHRRSGKYYEVEGREIRSIIVHQTAGGFRDGLEACTRLADWITRPPRYEARNGRSVRVGGGRGFPGAPYTFMVPNRPDVHDGKLVVYRMWDDQWVTWHTRRHNRDGVGVAFAGSFRTRHAPRLSDRAPTTMAMDAGADLVENYLLPRHGLSWDDVLGHFDAGKPTCPGDDLEAWIRRERGEAVDWFEVDDSHDRVDRRPLVSPAQRRAALAELGREGFRLAEREGFRLAVESVQEQAGIVVDGIWGPQTERAVRRMLASA